jgi:hypothetical protein
LRFNDSLLIVEIYIYGYEEKVIYGEYLRDGKQMFMAYFMMQY